MKTACRVINVCIRNLPDDTTEDDIGFVVDTSKLEVTASVKGEEVPNAHIDIEVEDDIYLE